MSTCENCIHSSVCTPYNTPNDEYPNIGDCPHFKNRADYVEVKYGEWISELVERCDWRGRKQKYYQPNSCNLCHKAVLERTNFCPNCGAKMKARCRGSESCKQWLDDRNWRSIWSFS